MNSVTAENIRRRAPDATGILVKAIVAGWPAAEQAGINTPLRTQHFFAQVATETLAIQSISEGLNYKAAALLAKFSRERISVADCQRLGRTAEHPADQQGIA